MNKNAIIIGASSGIGKALARVLSQKGYKLGLAARRLSLLQELKDELPTDVFIKEIDVSVTAELEKRFELLLQEMGDVDLVIISAGTGYHNPELDTDLELETIDTNVRGFLVVANLTFRYFLMRGRGHLVGISSIASIRGNAEAPSYNASKAFVSNYLEGLRLKSMKNELDITVTDILPGFVDTQMAKGDDLFWVSSPEKAAKQIFQAIKEKKSHAYITKRWKLIALLMKLMPDFLLKKF